MSDAAGRYPSRWVTLKATGIFNVWCPSIKKCWGRKQVRETCYPHNWAKRWLSNRVWMSYLTLGFVNRRIWVQVRPHAIGYPVEWNQAGRRPKSIHRSALYATFLADSIVLNGRSSRALYKYGDCFVEVLASSGKRHDWINRAQIATHQSDPWDAISQGNTTHLTSGNSTICEIMAWLRTYQNECCY